jgi:hypothetical protein
MTAFHNTILLLNVEHNELQSIFRDQKKIRGSQEAYQSFV